jgi:hypothetical protein
VYACKQCGAKGKNIPLQWIKEYQRWYCYECKQYAPSSDSPKTEEESGAHDLLSQLPSSVPYEASSVPCEAVIDSSDGAIIREHQSSADRFLGNRGQVQPLKGALALTNLRFCLRTPGQGFSKQLSFEAIYHWNFAIWRIDRAKERAEEILQQYKKLSLIGKMTGGSLRGQGYPIPVPLLTELQVGEMGEAPITGLVGAVWNKLSRKHLFLLLKTHYLWITPKGWGKPFLKTRTWELWPGPHFLEATDDSVLQNLIEKIKAMPFFAKNLESYAAEQREPKR